MRHSSRLAKATSELSRRLELWRQSHRAPAPIPQDIWEGAVDLAVEQGISPTARALHLDHGALKRRLDARSNLPARIGVQFVELLPDLAGSVIECAMEVESALGARLRVELKNLAPSGLASILREFAR
jgi:hypothetical protein